jgi:hypothetical protein
MSQILELRLKKPSQILRAVKDKYIWTRGGLAIPWDSQKRCAIGAIIGYLGWDPRGDDSNIACPPSEYLGKLNEIGIGFDMVMRIESFNDGHSTCYDDVADWMEAQGL